MESQGTHRCFVCYSSITTGPHAGFIVCFDLCTGESEPVNMCNGTPKRPILNKYTCDYDLFSTFKKYGNVQTFIIGKEYRLKAEDDLTTQIWVAKWPHNNTFGWPF